MKTKNWILIFSVLAAVCIALSLFLYAQPSSSCARVYSDGELIMTLDLSEDGQSTVMYGAEWNVITVTDGKVSVTSASCASQDCVHRGAADHGAPIVCLPNRLVIEFSDEAPYDALIG